MSREARPAWAKALILLVMPLSPPALPICLPFLAFWPSRGQPSPTSHSPPSTNHPLSPTREINLLPPFLGLRASSSSRPQGSCWCGSNPFASVSSASSMVLQSVLPESPFFPFFRRVSGRFVPRLDKIDLECSALPCVSWPWLEHHEAQRVCPRPIQHPILPLGSWKAFPPWAGRTQTHPCRLWLPQVSRFVQGCVGTTSLAGLWDQGCPIPLRVPKPCRHLLKGGVTHAFEQLWMPGPVPGCRVSVSWTPICPLSSSVGWGQCPCLV